MALVNGRCVGGTTTISAGNAVRMDQDLKELGIDLDREFDELSREVPVSTDHIKGWRPDTRQLFSLCREMGLSPRATPKLIDSRKCRRCGRCILGCPTGAKWQPLRGGRQPSSEGLGKSTHPDIMALLKAIGKKISERAA